EPEPTSSPESTNEPEPTSSPESTNEPEPTSEPESTSEPEAPLRSLADWRIRKSASHRACDSGPDRADPGPSGPGMSRRGRRRAERMLPTGPGPPAAAA